MQETGIIVSIDGPIAQVKIERGEQCKECKICESFGDNKMKICARNEIGAQVGDRVQVSIKPRQVIGHSLLIFVFPILMMIAGYFVGQAVAVHSGSSGENMGILISLAALVVSFFLIKLFDKRSNTETTALIVNKA